jgi:hypothetical protein
LSFKIFFIKNIFLILTYQIIKKLKIKKLKFLKTQPNNKNKNSMRYLEIWLLLPFKIFFIHKNIKMIFFYFKKIIFNISILEKFENIKKILIWSKEKKFNFFLNARTINNWREGEETSLRYWAWTIKISSECWTILKNTSLY